MQSTAAHTLYARLNAGRDPDGALDNIVWARLVAALLVVYGHCYALVASPVGVPRELDWVQSFLPGTYAGNLGVQLFFFLSGLLIVHSWRRRPEPLRFIRARLRRLLPGLWVCVLLTAVLLGPALTRLEFAAYFSSPETGWYVLRNASMVWPQFELPGVLQAAPYPNVVNGSLWSLRVEVLCYWLVLCLGLARTVGQVKPSGSATEMSAVPRPRDLNTAAAGWSKALWTLLLISAAIALLRPSPHLESLRLISIFAFGASCAVCAAHLRPAHGAWLVLALVAMLFAHFSATRPAGAAWPNLAPYGEGARTLMCVGFAMWFCFRLPALEHFLPGRLARVGVALRQNDLSYGVYLYAFPVQQLLVEWLPSLRPSQLFALSAPLALLCGWLSYRFVERHWLEKSHVQSSS